MFGKQVMLADARTVLADENYIRESIVNPQAKIVQGFQPIMPTFAGQVSEEDLLKLLAYIKSLQAAQKTSLAVESPQSMQTSAGAPAQRPAAAPQPPPQQSPRE